MSDFREGQIVYLIKISEILEWTLISLGIKIGDKGIIINLKKFNDTSYVCFNDVCISEGTCTNNLGKPFRSSCKGLSLTLFAGCLELESELESRLEIEEEYRRIRLKKGKVMTKEELKKAILGIVSSGIKITELITKLPEQTYSCFQPQEIMATIQELINEGAIVEIEYTLPDNRRRIKSFLLPKGTELLLKEKEI